MARPPRNIWKSILNNFLDSLRPRPFRGNFIGTDVLGNKYFEIPADPKRGKRNASRWFTPVMKEDFAQDLPAEWHSWLRGQRTEPPTEDEIAENTRIMLLKKSNANQLLLERKGAVSLEVEVPKKGFESYPSYGTDFEIRPGVRPKLRDEIASTCCSIGGRCVDVRATQTLLYMFKFCAVGSDYGNEKSLLLGMVASISGECM